MVHRWSKDHQHQRLEPLRARMGSFHPVLEGMGESPGRVRRAPSQRRGEGQGDERTDFPACGMYWASMLDLCLK